MLVPAKNADIMQETVKHEKETLRKLIDYQVFDTTILLREDDGMFLLLADGFERVWGDFHEDRYGWNPLKGHDFYFANLVLEDEHIVFIKEKTNIQAFTEKIKQFIVTPSVANQPIIYKHSQPRHRSELLYFDSPSCFFFFISMRGYTPYLTNESEVYNGPGVIYEEVTDGTRESINGKKRYGIA